MKRFTLGLACLSLVAAMSSCSKNAEKATEETAGSEQTVGLKIAYVELDTLMSQYQLYKDYSELLTRKGNNIQNTATAYRLSSRCSTAPTSMTM